MGIVSRAQLEASLAGLCTQVDDPRAGILGPRSLAWRLGGDLAIFAGGGRAALLQLAHPMVAHAIDHHSRTRADIAGRFQRTFRHVFAMVFGELDDALAAARRVHTIHARIHGVFDDAHGEWPAGTRYDANDEEALGWVHATLVDSTLCVREQLEGPLPIAIKDRYVVEMRRFAALFGIPAAQLPDGWAAHARYMRTMLGAGRLVITPAAREMAGFLFGRGSARGATPTPLGRLAEAVTVALLPPALAAGFGLTASPRAGRLALDAFCGVYRRLPGAAVALPARVGGERRLAGRGPSAGAAWVERQLFGLARRTTGA